MANGIDIVIGAEVSGALQGLQKVEAATVKAGATINKLPASINSTNQALAKLVPGANQANQSMVNLSRVVQDAPFGFIGIANNIDPLLQSFQSLKASTGSSKEAFKALGSSLMGGGGLALGVSLVTSALVVFGDKLFGSSKAAKEAKGAADALKDSITGIFSSQAKESAEVAGFIGILKNETETRERKLAAIKELQQIQPEVFNNLKLEGNAVAGLDAAYSNYLDNLKTVIAVKIKQAQLEQQIAELLKKQGVTLTQSEKQIAGFIENTENRILDRAKRAGGAEGLSYIESVYGKKEKRKQDEEKLKSEIDALLKDITGLSKGIKVKEFNIKPDKVKIDDELSKVIRLEKPIPIEASLDLKRINEVMAGTDLLQSTKISDRLKSMEKLVVKPEIRLSSEVLNNQAMLQDIRMFSEAINTTLNEGLQSGFTDAMAGFADGIGQAFAGGDLKNAFSAFAGAIGGALQAMGKQIIGIGLAAIAAKKAIAALFTNPLLAIAAGAGLVAAGAALKGALSNFGGFRAGGGPVGAGQSYVVGENGPELFVPANNGRIMNGNQVAAMSYSGGGSSSGGRQIVRGQNIILAYARTNRAQNRLGRG